MATSATFSAMLNEHLNYKLLKAEYLNRDYILSKVEKDDNWEGGNLVVPFRSHGASSIALGGLSASNDIAEEAYTRGIIANQPEVWSSLLFQHKDLMQHGRLSEQNFLKILPDAIDDFMDYIKMTVSSQITNGPIIAKATGAGTNQGVVTVTRPERFTVGQKVHYLGGPVAVVATAYVVAVDINAGTITLNTSRTNNIVVDASGFTNAVAFYLDGGTVALNQLSSIKSLLLPAAAGGTANIYGVSKLASKYTQSISFDGGAGGLNLTANNIISTIFNAYTQTRVKGKGNPNTCLMSYRNLGWVMQQLETQKGAFHIRQDSTKVSAYGWTEIEIFGVQGALKVVGMVEMDDDFIVMADMSSYKFHSNKFFQKRKSPDGTEFYEIRNTTGFAYIVDIALMGDLVCNAPCKNGIIYGIA